MAKSSAAKKPVAAGMTNGEAVAKLDILQGNTVLARQQFAQAAAELVQEKGLPLNGVAHKFHEKNLTYGSISRNGGGLRRMQDHGGQWVPMHFHCFAEYVGMTLPEWLAEMETRLQKKRG